MKAKLSLALFLGLAFVGRAPGQLPGFSPPPRILPQEIFQGRDLDRYDDGGKFAAALLSPPKIESIIKLRSFILQHWKEHRSAYVRVDFSGKDNLAETYIFIEPNEAGAWHIIWRIVHHQAANPPPPPRLVELPEMTSLERAKRSKESLPGAHVLIFRDKDGNEIQQL